MINYFRDISFKLKNYFLINFDCFNGFAFTCGAALLGAVELFVKLKAGGAVALKLNAGRVESGCCCCC